MRLRIGVLALGLCLPAIAVGCSSNDSGAEQPQQTGTFRQQLVTVTNGTTYRLRNAIFTVSGPSTVELNSETDPSATALTADLPVGTYDVLLNPGWALERVDGMGAVVVQASLVSANPVTVQVLPGSTANAAFRFSTDGTIIDIGTGSISITIEVEDNGGGAGGSGGGSSCDPLDQTTCPAGQGCYFDGEAGICAPVAGSGVQGEPCEYVNGCSAGYLCASADGINNLCYAFCDPLLNDCAVGTCADIGSGLGLCVN